MAHHLIPFTGILCKINPPWMGTVTTFSLSGETSDIFSEWKISFGGKNSVVVDSNSEELEKSTESFAANSLGDVFKSPYRKEQVEKVLNGLINSFREPSEIWIKELFVLETIRLNHLAYHILDTEFRKIAFESVGKLTNYFHLFSKMLRKIKKEEQASFIFRRHFQLLLFNYSLIHPKELRKNRGLVRYLLEEATEDLGYIETTKIIYADHRGCCLLHCWRAIMNIACFKLRDKGTGKYSFTVFMRFYEKIMAKPFDIPLFIKNTVLPIMLKFYTRRKNLRTEIDRRGFLVHPYIFLYGVIFYTGSYDSVELQYLKHYCNDPQMLLSILQDLSFFSKELCTVIKDMDSRIENKETKLDVTGVSSAFTMFYKFKNILENIVLILNWMTLNRVSSDIILSSSKYVKFLSKKYIEIYELFEQGGFIFREEVFETKRIQRGTISNCFNLFYYAPTTESKKIACGIIEPFLAKYFRPEYFKGLDKDLKRVFLKLMLASNYVFRTKRILVSPDEITNHDSWWFENGMIKKASEIVRQIFHEGEVFTKNPKIPFRDKDDPNIILYAVNLASFLFEFMVTDEKKNDFLMNKEEKTSKMCLLEKLLICYWKGPPRVKQAIVKSIELKTTSSPAIVFKSIRDFIMIEGKKKWYCNIDRLIRNLGVEEENCVVLDLKTRFNEMKTYFEAMKNDQIAFLFETDEEFQAMHKLMKSVDQNLGETILPRREYIDSEEYEDLGNSAMSKEKRKKEKNRFMKEGFAQVFNDCGYCHAHHAPKMCSRCRIQKYCSPECQKKHWMVHKKECKKKLR